MGCCAGWDAAQRLLSLQVPPHQAVSVVLPTFAPLLNPPRRSQLYGAMAELIGLQLGGEAPEERLLLTQFNASSGDSAVYSDLKVGLVEWRPGWLQACLPAPRARAPAARRLLGVPTAGAPWPPRPPPSLPPRFMPLNFTPWAGARVGHRGPAGPRHVHARRQQPVRGLCVPLARRGPPRPRRPPCAGLPQVSGAAGC